MMPELIDQDGRIRYTENKWIKFVKNYPKEICIGIVCLIFGIIILRQLL